MSKLSHKLLSFKRVKAVRELSIVSPFDVFLTDLCSSSEFWSSDIDQCVSCSSCKQYPKTPSCNTCKKSASSSCSAEPIEETTGPLYQA
uniref:TNFR-Cys domain-containing protein n=1 Tax=Oncorhynchus tshawytscha TaxID=74940 RepID=A0A8C8EJC6_ONCTS